MRATFINTLTELARNDSKIMLIIGDTGYSIFEKFEEEFKERFVNVGIAEQNFVSFAAGLAAMNMKPYIYNVASFMTLRALEQIVLDVCYQDNPVVLVGVGGGFAYAQAGPTHHACHDIATMSMIPNMTVVCPGDPIEMRETVIAVASYNRPVYIRLGRSENPQIHQNNINFKIGKSIKIQEGNDIALFATGTMLKDAVEICELLKIDGISTTLYSMHTIKPIDQEAILEAAKLHKAIFTLEEHSVIGGLGAAVSNVLVQFICELNIKFKSYGVPDTFAPVTGSRDYLNQLFKIDPLSISEDIRKILRLIDN